MPTITRRQGTLDIVYEENSHVMVMFVDWRERYPPFYLKTMKWEPPHDSEPLTMERKLEVLAHVANWLKSTGREGLVIDEIGYFDGEKLVPENPSEYWESLKDHWIFERDENGGMRLIPKRSNS